MKKEESPLSVLPLVSARAQRFLNLFQIDDPCDPDLIDREDLRTEDMNYQSTGRNSLDNLNLNRSYPGLRPKLPDFAREDDDFDYSDDALDIAHEQRFARVAQSLYGDHAGQLTSGESVKVNSRPPRRQISNVNSDNQRRPHTKRFIAETISCAGPSKQYSRREPPLRCKKTQTPHSSLASFEDRPSILASDRCRGIRVTPISLGVLDLDSSDEDLDEKLQSSRSFIIESYSSQSSQSTLLPPSSQGSTLVDSSEW